jgi:hypothetical protein
MRLLASALIALLNGVAIYVGLIQKGIHTPDHQAQSMATLTRVIISLPFFFTFLYALGARTRAVWATAAVLNTLLMMGCLAMVLFASQSGTTGSDGAIAVSGAMTGTFLLVNLAYLLWHGKAGPTAEATGPVGVADQPEGQVLSAAVPSSGDAR